MKYNLLFGVRHNFAWRFKGQKLDKWYITVASFPTSAQLVVHCKLVTSVGNNWHLFEPELLKDLVVVPVFGIKDVEVCKIKWRGPAWLTAALNRPLRPSQFGVIAEKVAGPMPLMTLACEEAFFCISHIARVVSVMVLVLLLFSQ